MVGKTYIKEKTKTLNSKYFAIREHINLNYKQFHHSLVSNFHRENTDFDKIRESLNQLLESSSLQYLTSSRSKKLDSSATISSKRESRNKGIDQIDWSRGRFVGKVIKMTIKNGQIMEKIFITPKGNIIIINRKDLGIFARLSISN